jgi:hypothetical protein
VSEGDGMPMSKLIMGATEDEEVIYLNENPFDNRRANLRIVNWVVLKHILEEVDASAGYPAKVRGLGLRAAFIDRMGSIYNDCLKLLSDEDLMNVVELLKEMRSDGVSSNQIVNAMWQTARRLTIQKN